MLSRKWRAADERISMPDTLASDTFNRIELTARFGRSTRWLVVAGIATLAVVLMLNPPGQDDVSLIPELRTVVPELANDQIAQGPCSSYDSCISLFDLLARVNPD